MNLGIQWATSMHMIVEQVALDAKGERARQSINAYKVIITGPLVRHDRC